MKPNPVVTILGAHRERPLTCAAMTHLGHLGIWYTQRMKEEHTP